MLWRTDSSLQKKRQHSIKKFRNFPLYLVGMFAAIPYLNYIAVVFRHCYFLSNDLSPFRFRYASSESLYKTERDNFPKKMYKVVYCHIYFVFLHLQNMLHIKVKFTVCNIVT